MTSNTRVLVAAGVDPTLISLLGGQLEHVAVREADTVDEALAALDGSVDLLLVNHTLHGPAGADIVSRARARQGLRDLPVLYLLDPALDSTMGRELLQQLGVQTILVHPIDPDRLLDDIARVLGTPTRAGVDAVPPGGGSSSPGPEIVADSALEMVFQPVPRMDGERMLIVDADEAHGRQLVSEAATRGVRATLVGTPHDAREAWTRDRPDAVLLDLGIRNGNGEEGLNLLQELSQLTPPIPALVMTARDTFVDRMQVASSGGRGFLQRNQPAGEVLDTAMLLLQQLRTREMRVLVVDRDPETLEAVRSLLGHEGIRVTTLDDPLAFWDTLEQLAPDLLVLDVDLVRWSGIELCRVVRNDPRWSALPVVMLAERDDPETVRSIFAAGADDYLTKPVASVELTTRVVNRLERTLLYRSMAEIDPMTGVANRRKSTNTLRQFLRLAERHGQSLSLAILDVDWFKQINDRYGHDAGDVVLQHLGKTLMRTFRSEDIVARWGGEEFLIGMYGMSRVDGVQRLSDVLSGLHHEPVIGLGGESIFVTFSAGVAQFPEDGDDSEALVRAADRAMYRAKESGRDRVIPAGWVTERAETGVRAVDVAIVQSEETVSSQLINALEADGYRTHWLRDGETATLMLGGPEPAVRASVILIDVDVAGVDGLGVLRRLSRDGVAGRSRVMVLVPDAGRAVAARAQELGAFDTVRKPIGLAGLVERVHRATEVP